MIYFHNKGIGRCGMVFPCVGKKKAPLGDGAGVVKLAAVGFGFTWVAACASVFLLGLLFNTRVSPQVLLRNRTFFNFSLEKQKTPIKTGVLRRQRLVRCGIGFHSDAAGCALPEKGSARYTKISSSP